MKSIDINLSTSDWLWLGWFVVSMLWAIWGLWTDPYAGVHRAVAQGKLEKVRKYLEKGTDVEYKKNKHSSTPLYVAASKGKREIAELLIAYGATVNQGLEEENGENPLLAAVMEGHQGVVESLMTHGAIAGPHVAAFRGEIPMLRTYLEQGGDVNAKRNGMPLLHLAVSVGSREAIALLLANHADLNLRNSINKEPPLHRAVEKNHLEIVELLLDCGANIDCCSGRGTPLHLAISRKHREIIELLVAKGADVNFQRSSVKSPLSRAAELGLLEVAEFLLARGAKVDAKDTFTGETPLHGAVGKGHLEVAELLIARGANVNSRSWLQMTPLSQAKGKREMTELLRAHGATDYGWGD